MTELVDQLEENVTRLSILTSTPLRDMLATPWQWFVRLGHEWNRHANRQNSRSGGPMIAQPATKGERARYERMKEARARARAARAAAATGGRT